MATLCSCYEYSTTVTTSRWIPRSRSNVDARLAESGNARSKQLLVVPTESLNNRVWLEWIRMSKAQLVFRYEISDLLYM